MADHTNGPHRRWAQGPFARQTNPGIEWGHLPPWAVKTLQDNYPQGTYDLYEDEDEFGSTYTRLTFHRGNQSGAAGRIRVPDSYGLYFHPESQTLAVNRGGSSTFKLFTGSMDVRSRSEDDPIEPDKVWSVQENFKRFIQRPKDHFRNESVPNQGQMLFSQNVSQLNPNILRANSGAVQLPKTVRQVRADNREQIVGLGADVRNAMVDHLSQHFRDDALVLRDNKVHRGYNYYENEDTMSSAFKDQRRLHRPTDLMLNKNFESLPQEQASSFFEGQSPRAGMRMSNLFIDDPLLFSEGNALTMSGRHYTQTPTSYNVPDSIGMDYAQLEEMGFNVGNVYGKSKPRNLPEGLQYGGAQSRLGEYSLGNNTMTAVMGATYQQETGWTVHMSKINPFELAENKSHPGVKRVNMPVNEQNPLFRAAWGQGMNPDSISVTPSKPARLLENARAGFMAIPADQQAEFFRNAAKAGGYDDAEINKMLRFHEKDNGQRQVEFLSGSAPVFDAAAMDYMKTRSGKMRVNAVVSKFALDEMKERMGEEEYTKRYGNPRMKGNVGYLDNYEVGYTEMDLLETPHGLATSGKTKISAHRLNLLARNQPAAYADLIARADAGEFQNHSREFLRADMANQNIDVKNNIIDVDEMPLRAIYQTAMHNVGGEKAAVHQEMFEIMAAMYPDQYIGFGGVNFPSAQALASLVQDTDFSEGGAPVSDFGRQVGDLLMSAASGEKDKTKVLDAAKSLHEYAMQEGTQKKAKSLILPAFSGAARASTLLPQGYAIANETEILSYIKGMNITEERRAEVMSQFMRGEGVVGNMYMQESNEYTSSAMVRVLSLQQATQQFQGLKDLVLKQGQTIVSAEDVGSADKDLDGDLMSIALLSVRPEQVDFTRQKQSKFWGRGGEVLGWLDKVKDAGKATALMAMDSWTFVRDKAGYKSMGSLVNASKAANTSSSEMGLSFGPFVERLGGMTWQVGQEAEVSDMAALQAAAAFVGNQVYQQAMDMKYSKSEGTQWMQKFAYRFAIGADKMGNNRPQSGMKGDKSSQILSGDMSKLALYMFQNAAKLEVGAQPDREEDAAQYIGGGKDPGFASFYARMLTSLQDSGDQERVTQVRDALVANYNDEDSPQNKKLINLLSAITGENYSDEETSFLGRAMAAPNLVGYKNGIDYKGKSKALEDIKALMIGTQGIKETSAIGAFLSGSGGSNTVWRWHQEQGPKQTGNSLIGRFTNVMDTIRKSEMFRKGQDTDVTLRENLPTLASTLQSGLAGTRYIAEGLLRDESQQFYRGGYTGDGEKHDPRGIVHAGEYVLNQEDVRDISSGAGHLVMRKVERDLAREGESSHMLGYEEGGSPGRAYESWLDTEREYLSETFYSAVHDRQGEARGKAFNAWLDITGDVLGRSPGAIKSEAYKIGLIGEDTTFGKAPGRVAGGGGGSGRGGAPPPPPSAPIDPSDRSSYVGPLATAPYSDRITEDTAGKTEMLRKGRFDGDWATPSQMTISANSAGEYGVAMQVPYDANTIEDLLARYASRMTVGRGQGAEEVLGDPGFMKALSGNLRRVTSILGMTPEQRIAMDDKDREEFSRSLGALQMVDKNVKAMQTAGRGGAIPRPVQDLMTQIGGELQTAESQGFKGESQGAYEERTVKKNRAARESASNLEFRPDDIARFKELGAWVKTLEDVDNVVGRINDKQQDYIKHGNEIVGLYENAVQTLQAADKALKDVGGDRTKLSDSTRSVLDNAEVSDGSGRTLRQRLEVGAANAGRLSEALVSADVYKRSRLFDNEEDRQTKLTTRLLQGGRIGALRRQELGDEFFEGGLDIGLGFDLKGQGAIRGLAGAARVAQRLGSAMWGWSHFSQNIINPMQGYAQQYEQSVMQRQAALGQTGALGYEDIMAGEPGDILRRQQQMNVMQQGIGRQIYNSYSGLFSGVDPREAGTAAGALISIGGPALGAAMTVTQMTANPFAGALAGIGTGAVAAGAWLEGARNDVFTAAQGANAIYRSRAESAERWGGNASDPINAIRGVLNQDLGTFPQALAFATAPQEVQEQARSYNQANILLDRYVSGGLPYTTEADVHSRTMTLPGMDETMYQMTRQEAYLRERQGRGISDQMALSSYTFAQIYGGGNLGDPFLNTIDRYNMMGWGDPAQLASSLAPAMNLGANNVSGIYGLATGLGSYLDTLPAEQRTATSMRLQEMQGMMAGVNQSRVLSGQTPIDPSQWANYMGGDPTRQGLGAQLDMQQAQAMVSNPTYAAQMWQYDSDVRRMITSGDDVALRYAQRSLNASQQASAYSMQMQAGGALTSDQQQQALIRYRSATSSDQYQLDQVMQRDPFALTRRGLFNMMDLETGYDTFTFNISGADQQQLNRTAQQWGLQSFQMQDGMSVAEMQAEQVGMQRRRMNMQYNFGRDQQLMQMALTTGGATVDGAGFALGGNLDQLQALMQQYGQQFNVGNGMGLWQLQDAQTRMQRQQQDFSLSQQSQSLAIQQQSFVTQGSQFYERTGLQERQTMAGFARDEREMGISREQQITRAGWQMEDLAFGRAQMDVQFGWQQEDFTREIRYARGMDKRNLMRQQDRSVIQYAMNANQQARQEGRAQTEMGWATESFNRQKEYFDQNKQFTLESIEMSKRHFEQDRNFDRQRLQMAETAHQREMQWLQESRQYEDQGRLIERQFQIAQNEMNLKISQQFFEMDQRAQTLAVNLGIASQAMQDMANRAAAMGSSGELLGAATGTSSNGSLGTASGYGQYHEGQIMTAADGKQYRMVNGGWVPVQMSPNTSSNSRYGGSGGFASGGYTGKGGKYDQRGPVHAGEWVVPQEGAMVVRGNTELDKVIAGYLKELVDMKKEQLRSPQQVAVQLNMPPVNSGIPATQRSRAKL